MGTSAAIQAINIFIIVIYDLWPSIVFSSLSLLCPFGNGRIEHFTDLLHDLLGGYYKYCQNM